MTLDYRWLYDTARRRFESDEAMEAFLPKALAADELKQKGDDRYLSAMSQRVFRAGMQHSVVDAKWPAFEEAFWGFVPETMVLLSPEQIEGYMKNDRIIRHRTKLQTIPKNAQFILDIRQEQGSSFGEFIANWPSTDIVGLWRLLAKRGARLGGRSASAFLRLVGKDTFLLTSDVVARLIAAGVVDQPPTSQRDMQAVQGAFNELQQSSGRPLCQLSAMLSLSINPRF
ncbi:DNA-3-methyladenine glycosylase I [Halomonas sp. McH1-25]|uniref:DNA-3-methyladenine glycosylase I n=1 Tax=unclassified Halomonas TaxID=2609666 RepID=UPI001EF44080|nr:MULTISPECIES: DNA-3-methyladenine glycosylase I [unclassified Halomonas]MCG7598241.1 DNA-3-methyladenine glycosylase I [Halomonas sp. McH1-25]MCP1340976.1 DNA-3-methyladenine glycosylase I [Halomonas sp. FL8]MCP1361460.1 DNA-3-methyladenine glycosylase I [Halomonas sp. BBD45]